jgi:hypothetical protein
MASASHWEGFGGQRRLITYSNFLVAVQASALQAIPRSETRITIQRVDCSEVEVLLAASETLEVCRLRFPTLGRSSGLDLSSHLSMYFASRSSIPPKASHLEHLSLLQNSFCSSHGLHLQRICFWEIEERECTIANIKLYRCVRHSDQ